VKIIQTTIPEVIVFEPTIFGDQRGYFFESFRLSWLEEAGIKTRFIQDNVSRSRKGTLRGMHYQLVNPQAKLVMVTRGEVLDVAVDVRKGSPTYGQHASAILSEENRLLMYIPEGFAHGFQVLSETADFMYKCSNYYDPSSERGINAMDTKLRLPWHDITPITSERDQKLPLLDLLPTADHPIY
jgi:dTDP-4-dehydrorhamnose 3,5-epimerase